MNDDGPEVKKVAVTHLGQTVGPAVPGAAAVPAAPIGAPPTDATARPNVSQPAPLYVAPPAMTPQQASEEKCRQIAAQCGECCAGCWFYNFDMGGCFGHPQKAKRNPQDRGCSVFRPRWS